MGDGSYGWSEDAVAVVGFGGGNPPSAEPRAQYVFEEGTGITSADTSGWVDLQNTTFAKVMWQIDQLNCTGGIDVRVECKDLIQIGRAHV